MTNKHSCQGTHSNTNPTSDRFLKSKGIIRGRYAYAQIDGKHSSGYYGSKCDRYFCSQQCKFDWLSQNMENIEQGRPIEFIRHRRESQGYAKVTNTNSWGRTYTQIERVDNRTEID